MNICNKVILIGLILALLGCGGSDVNSEGEPRANADDVYAYFDESYRQCYWNYFKELTGATIWPWWYADDNVDNVKAIFFVLTKRMTVEEVEAMRLSIADVPIYISTIVDLPDTLHNPTTYWQGAIDKINVEAAKNDLWTVVLDRKRDHHKWLTVDPETNVNGYYFKGCDVMMETIAEIIYGSVISFD